MSHAGMHWLLSSSAATGAAVARAHVGHEQLHAAAAAEFIDLRREGHVHPLADAHAQLRRGAREEDAGIIIPALGKMQPQVAAARRWARR